MRRARPHANTVAFAVVAAVVAALLAGCAPDTGTVRGKRVTAACAGTPPVCHVHHQLWISNPDQHSWPYTDRPAAGWIDVDPATYGSYRVGDPYPHRSVSP